MKKTEYIQPVTSVILIHTGCHVLGGSPFNGNNAKLDPEYMDEGDGTDAGSRRRRRNVWDDEEEEEEEW